MDRFVKNGLCMNLWMHRYVQEKHQKKQAFLSNFGMNWIHQLVLIYLLQFFWICKQVKPSNFLPAVPVKWHAGSAQAHQGGEKSAASGLEGFWTQFCHTLLTSGQFAEQGAQTERVSSHQLITLMCASRVADAWVIVYIVWYNVV